MSPGVPVLRFAWWNVQSFAHFDPNRAGEERWPLEPAEYAAKCVRVDAALRGLIVQHPPDILGLCEITARAAEELRQRVFTDYRLICPDTVRGEFQVAVLARRGIGFRDLLPLLADRVPTSTRGMPVIDHRRAGHHIRFIYCHWTAFGDNGPLFRERAAERVEEAVYSFLREPGDAKSARHAVVIGDLNEEPFGNVFSGRLPATRDREPATRRPHPTDRDVRRTRLYNPTWRLLGERVPHGGSGPAAHAAGSYYHAGRRAWHTYDQLLVSGSLLSDTPPFLDEAAFRIMVLPGCLGPDGKPSPFEWRGGQPVGVSDHLPLVGQITLPPG